MIFKISYPRWPIGEKTMLLFLTITFAYPITIFVPYLFNYETIQFSITFRIIFFIINLLIIGRIFLIKKFYILNWEGLALTLFFICYFTRFFFDVLLRGIVFNDEIFYTLSFAFTSCFFPYIAITIGSKYMAMEKAGNFIYPYVFIACLAVMLMVVKSYFSEPILSILSVRLNLQGLNPIMVSGMGGFLFISSVIRLINREAKAVFSLAGIGIGLFLLILGASRAPFLISAALILYCVHYYIFLKKFAIIPILKLFLIIGSVSLFVFVIISKFWPDLDFALAVRIIEFANSGNLSEMDAVRSQLWEAAFRQFMENPIFGNSYLEVNSCFYPHNIFLEVLMSTGIVGTLFFVLALVLTIIKVIKLLGKPEYNIFGICFIFLFLSQMTSGGLFLNGSYWLISSLILNGRYKSEL